MTDDIDHEFTDEVVCPYCGQTHEGTGVFDGTPANDTTHECDRCGRTFEVTRDFDVYYITRAPQEGR